MNEVKFQVFDFREGVMRSWDFLKSRDDLGLILEGHYPFLSPPLQYVWQKDFLSREIYVRDIVEGELRDFINVKCSEEGKVIGEVSRRDYSCFELKYKGEKGEYHYLPFSAFERLRRRGSIYENPDLLDAKFYVEEEFQAWLNSDDED